MDPWSSRRNYHHNAADTALGGGGGTRVLRTRGWRGSNGGGGGGSGTFPSTISGTRGSCLTDRVDRRICRALLSAPTPPAASAQPATEHEAERPNAPPPPAAAARSSSPRAMASAADRGIPRD